MEQKKAHIALSFDDGRQDNVDIIKKLVTNHIPATLYVATGYVDGSCRTVLLPTDKPAMHPNDIVRLYQNPLVEIGMHGDMHLNEDSDIAKGREKLLNWLNLEPSNPLGFASPGTSFSIPAFLQSNNVLYTDEIAYLAMGLRIKKKRRIRIICRKIARVIPSGFLFKTAYHDTLMQTCPDRVIYRVPVLRSTSSRQVICLLKKALKTHACVILMFHSIGDSRHDDVWTWDSKKFENVCNFLQKERDNDTVNLSTVMQVFQTLQERSV